jgi:hypothetical protein
MQRVVASFLLLPLAAITLLAVYGAVTARPGSAFQTVLDGRYFALWYGIVCYFALAFLALPMLLVAIRKGWVGWWQSATAGALIGAVVFALPAVPSLFDERLHLHFRLAQLLVAYWGALVGIAHGLLFWVLAFWRNAAALSARHVGTNAA